LVFITGRNKRAIEDHFDNNHELEVALRLKNKNGQADMVKISCQKVWNVFVYASPNSWASVMRFSVLNV
jgi:UTP-glucose-1-phosphate uridylyltransferase